MLGGKEIDAHQASAHTSETRPRFAARAEASLDIQVRFYRPCRYQASASSNVAPREGPSYRPGQNRKLPRGWIRKVDREDRRDPKRHLLRVFQKRHNPAARRQGQARREARQSGTAPDVSGARARFETGHARVWRSDGSGNLTGK